MFRGNYGGCVEGRGPKGRFNGCEFDGRFSLVHYRDRFLIFARANIASGLRSVQMISSEDLVEWSPFQLINVSGVNHKRSQLYFLSAAVVQVDQWIVGYFPGELKFLSEDGLCKGPFPPHQCRSKGVHITWSQDGLNWTPPRNVLRGRTLYTVHPVGMLNRRLLTQRPVDVSRAFEFSQQFNDIEEMSKPLSLTVLGRTAELLAAPMREDVVYNETVWNE